MRETERTFPGDWLPLKPGIGPRAEPQGTGPGAPASALPPFLPPFLPPSSLPSGHHRLCSLSPERFVPWLAGDLRILLRQLWSCVFQLIIILSFALS